MTTQLESLVAQLRALPILTYGNLGQDAAQFIIDALAEVERLRAEPTDYELLEQAWKIALRERDEARARIKELEAGIEELYIQRDAAQAEVERLRSMDIGYEEKTK
jgi:hypothetical protein